MARGAGMPTRWKLRRRKRVLGVTCPSEDRSRVSGGDLGLSGDPPIAIQEAWTRYRSPDCTMNRQSWQVAACLWRNVAADVRAAYPLASGAAPGL